MRRICKSCGMEFESIRVRRNCSVRCYRMFYARRNRHKRRTPRACGVCGAMFVSERKHVRFCSAACFGKSQSCANPVPMIQCQRCGESFKRRSDRHGYNKYCSRECYFGVAKRERPKCITSRRICKTVRRQISERDGMKCRACGVEVRDDVDDRHPQKLNIDHVFPVSRGGTHAVENLQCLCRACNASKADKVLPEVVR